MATIMQTESLKLFTRDIAAFSDVELDQYLEAHAGEIDVEDPEILKNDEVLLRRLRARAGAVDLDDLTARLENVSADRQWEAWHTGLDENENRDPHYASRDTTEPLDEDEEYRRGLEEETEYYNALVSEGGRPSHPLGLLGRDILENPGEYGEILSYWQRVNHDAEGRVWKVFGSQLWEWRQFCTYQRSARKGDYFLKYPQLVQKRLTRHGLERPFQLDKDLDQQDKLATWIEFLNYEYQDYDKDMRFVERHQTEYDAAWKELVDSQVLRPFETEEFIIYNPKSSVQRASEEERAEKAVESAKFAIIENANPDQAAQSQLAAAVKTLASIKRRSDLIYKFLKKTKLFQVTTDGKLKQSYVGAKDNAECRSILLRWILQQIPLIETELNQAKVAEYNSDGEESRHKLKRNTAGDLNEERGSKRRREGGGNGVSDEELAPKRRKHSIQSSNVAEPISIAEPLSVQSNRPDSGNSVVQMPPKLRKRQPKVYQKERKSRRIAGDSPEFGMLLKRGEAAPPHETPSRYPSNMRKPNLSSPRSQASSKKNSMAVKSAKFQGISKARRGETNRSKRHKKRIGD